ncbi:diguanylate cyclase [Eubacteriales bacterium OttesenSCG-928-N14]|nr:diguanylate cyclase [Eubacteriales bacterium OttesenSCG-928-N14]
MRTLLTIYLIFTLFISIFALGFSLTRRDSMRSLCPSIFSIATIIYVIGYMLLINSNSLDQAIYALKVENAGIPFIPAFFLLISLSIFRRDLLKKRYIIAGVVYGVAMFIIIFFNEYHHLYYATIGYEATTEIPLLYLTNGPLYLIHQVVVVSCVVLAYYLLIKKAIHTTKAQQRQYVLYILSTSILMVANVLNALRVLPGIDFAPLTMALVLFSVMRFVVRYRLMDVQIIASERVVDSMDDAVIVFDFTWTYLYANDAALEVVPALKDISSTSHIGSIPGWPFDTTGLDEWTEEDEFSFTLEREDMQISYLGRISAVTDMDRTEKVIGYVVTISNITKLAERLEQMERLASLDSLTNIYNRRYFFDALTYARQVMDPAQTPMSVIMFDLDDFKLVNDTHGHVFGDEVLRQLSHVVQTQLRASDVLARYGGEEFVIALIGADLHQAVAMAERLRSSIEQATIDYNGVSVQLTASFGVIQMTPQQTLQDAIEGADKAMYLAKSKGKNRVEALHDDTNNTQAC